MQEYSSSWRIAFKRWNSLWSDKSLAAEEAPQLSHATQTSQQSVAQAGRIPYSLSSESPYCEAAHDGHIVQWAAMSGPEEQSASSEICPANNAPKVRWYRKRKNVEEARIGLSRKCLPHKEVGDRQQFAIGLKVVVEKGHLFPCCTEFFRAFVVSQAKRVFGNEWDRQLLKLDLRSPLKANLPKSHFQKLQVLDSCKF